MSIKFNDVYYTYSPNTPFEHEALKGISFEIKDGSFTCLVGHTGCGKSTLIQHLNGLIKVQDKKNSSVIVNGLSATDKKTLKKLRFEVGIVFQYPEYQLFEDELVEGICQQLN